MPQGAHPTVIMGHLRAPGTALAANQALGGRQRAGQHGLSSQPLPWGHREMWGTQHGGLLTTPLQHGNGGARARDDSKCSFFFFFPQLFWLLFCSKKGIFLKNILNRYILLRCPLAGATDEK